ncbi:MAG: DUF6089 family protein [Chitinophagales bacterium]
MKHFTTFIFILLFSSALHAQQDLYKWRLGIHLGYMNYIGDKTIVPFTSKPVFLPYGVDLQYNFTPSFGINVMADHGKFSIPASDIDAVQPDFETDAKSVSLRLVYQFDNGKLLHARSLFSPYLFAGGGFGWYNIEAVTTEEVRTGFIPAGAGLKARLSDRFNLDLRGDMRYTFTDKLDANVSGTNNLNDFYYLITLSAHFNFGMRKAKYKAPAFYTGEKGWAMIPLEKPESEEEKIQPSVDSLKKTDIVKKEIADTAARIKKDTIYILEEIDVHETVLPKEKGVRILLNDTIISILVNENESLDFQMDPKLFRESRAPSRNAYPDASKSQPVHEIKKLQDEIKSLNLRIDSLSKHIRLTSKDSVIEIGKIISAKDSLKEQPVIHTVIDTVITPMKLPKDSMKLIPKLKVDTIELQIPQKDKSEPDTSALIFEEAEMMIDDSAKVKMKQIQDETPYKEVQVEKKSDTVQTPASVESKTDTVIEKQVITEKDVQEKTNTIYIAEPETSKQQLEPERDSLQQKTPVKIIRDTARVEVEKETLELAPVNVFFEKNSYVVEEPYRKQLSEFAQSLLAQSDTAKILVTGFADRWGESDYNKMLSEKRALAVKNVLEKNNIPAARILLRFFGDEKAVEGKSELHRKAEVKVLSE